MASATKSKPKSVAPNHSWSRADRQAISVRFGAIVELMPVSESSDSLDVFSVLLAKFHEEQVRCMMQHRDFLQKMMAKQNDVFQRAVQDLRVLPS